VPKKKNKAKIFPNRTSRTIENDVLISNWFHLTHNLTWQNSDTKGVKNNLRKFGSPISDIFRQYGRMKIRDKKSQRREAKKKDKQKMNVSDERKYKRAKR
jgi:hypothetical protein